MPASTTCRGTKNDGDPCQSTILGPDGYCEAHRPGNEGLMKKRASKGGKARAAKDHTLSLDDLPPLEDHGSVKVWLEHLARELVENSAQRQLVAELRKLLKEWVSVHRSEVTDEVLDDLRKEIEQLARRQDRIERRETEKSWR